MSARLPALFLSKSLNFPYDFFYETFVTNASAESLNSGIKGFQAELHGISNLPFFFYRVCKIYG